jgi:hypothetical protein
MQKLHSGVVQWHLVNQAEYFYTIKQQLRVAWVFRDPTSPRSETSLLNLLGSFGYLAFFKKLD